MFGALPMRRVVLHLLREDVEKTSLALAEAGVLDPEAVDPARGMEELPGEAFAVSLRLGARRASTRSCAFWLRRRRAGWRARGRALAPVSHEALAALDERLAARVAGMQPVRGAPAPPERAPPRRRAAKVGGQHLCPTRHGPRKPAEGSTGFSTSASAPWTTPSSSACAMP